MMEYGFYVSTSQSGGEKQGDIQIEAGIDWQMNLLVHTYRHTVIYTAHPIRLGFSQIIIQSEL